MSGLSTPNSREQLSCASSQGTEPPPAGGCSSDSLDTLFDPLSQPNLIPPPYASFVGPRPTRGLRVPQTPEPLHRQQPAEHVPLMAALQHSQEAMRAPVVCYTSNVTLAAQQRRLALGRIDARKASIRAALFGLEDSRWCNHAQYNLIKSYLSDIDARFNADHSVRLAGGLHLSRQGFCIEAVLSTQREANAQLFYDVLEPSHLVYVSPTRAAQNEGCLRLVQKHGLLSVLGRAALSNLLETLPAHLQLEEGRVYRPGPVLATTAALWALESICCLPLVPLCLLSDNLTRSAEEARLGEEDFQFWRRALLAEDREQEP